MRRINTKGFTVIELLISTVVFSLVLLILTGAIIQFNRLYYKGVVDTKTQEATRSITDDITRNIQFSADATNVAQATIPPDPPSNDGYICAGGYVYKYFTRQLVESGPALRKYKSDTCAAPTTTTEPGNPNGTELLGANMFLQNITLAGTGPYTLTVQVGYGALAEHNAGNGSCLFAVRVGGQFCAYHDLTVSVVRRLP